MLLDFLEEVVSHSSVNRMSLSNVAMFMAPNLFLAPKVQPPPPGGQVEGKLGYTGEHCDGDL